MHTKTADDPECEGRCAIRPCYAVPRGWLDERVRVLASCFGPCATLYAPYSYSADSRQADHAVRRPSTATLQS